jgi:hypothetical protein
MIAQKNLSGTGSTGQITYDKERAFLFRLRAGNDSRGNPVFLRKWIHAQGAIFSAQTIASGVLNNETGFTSADRASMVTKIQVIGEIGPGTKDWKLCSKSGRRPTAGSNWEAHKYFEHHQFGDQWRAA